MMALFRIGVALASALCIVGCATQPSTAPSAVVTPVRPKVIPADRIKDAVAIGMTSKADVIASLGETLVISFDTGYEVWVYTLAQDRTQRIVGRAAPGTSAEFVILFAPSGLVAKSRVRPAPQRWHEG
ncbi:MAG: hypothetical protein ACXWUB_08375 [Burkholderiales bacterium]